jgi:hypothetical protein
LCETFYVRVDGCEASQLKFRSAMFFRVRGEKLKNEKNEKRFFDCN